MTAKQVSTLQNDRRNINVWAHDKQCTYLPEYENDVYYLQKSYDQAF